MKRVKKFSNGGMGDDYSSSDDAKNLILAAEREDVERIGEDFAKTMPKSAPAAKSTSFKDAFAEARKAGDKTFEWNGKKYTTEMASDKKAKPVSRATDTGDETTRLSRRAPAPATAPAPRTFAERQEAAGRKMQGAYGDAVDNLKRGVRSIMGLKKGGMVSSASKRADGCAIRGKTRGRMV